LARLLLLGARLGLPGLLRLFGLRLPLPLGLVAVVAASGHRARRPHRRADGSRRGGHLRRVLDGVERLLAARLLLLRLLGRPGGVRAALLPTLGPPLLRLFPLRRHQRLQSAASSSPASRSRSSSSSSISSSSSTVSSPRS